MATPDRRPGLTDETRYLLPLVLTDDLTEGLVVVDRETVIQYANPAMTRIFAYGRDELVGEPLTAFTPEEYRTALGSFLATGERGLLPWSNVLLPGLHRDGQRLDLRISFTEFSRHGRRLFAGAIRDMTAAKGPEEEHRRLVRSYRALFEENVAAVFRAAPDGRILAANRALAQMTGRENPAGLRGRDVTGCFVEGKEREQLVADLREHREVHNRELRLRRADGGTQWSLVNAAWIDDPEDAEPEVLMGTVVDISDRKHIERELRLSEERHRRLFEQDLVGVFRSRPPPDGKILECNPALAELFGYASPAELAGTPAWAFFPSVEDRRAVVEAVRRGVGVTDETPLRRKDGSIIWGLTHVRRMEDPEHGEIVEGAIFDVSDRVRAREALERAKEKFEGIFDVSPVALEIVRAETDEFVEVNEEFEDLFGFERAERLEGSVTSDELWENPEQRDRIHRRLKQGDVVREAEVRLCTSDGSAFDALFSASKLQMNGDELLVAAVQDVSRLKEAERELEHRALHDALTDLPNRTLFWDRLEHALERTRRTGEEVAVLFLDLDGFGRINDEYGHASGDEALRQVTDRLEGAVREADTLARFGGDEFGVLLEDLKDPSEATEVARRLTEQFEAPILVAGDEVLIRVSCGIASAGGDDSPQAGTADELVHRADAAMYAAKDEPGSSVRRFGPEISDARTGRLKREIELKGALEAGHVVSHFQPLVDLEDGRIVGAEALARWEHPERGLIGPGSFIPVAEETGLIVEVGRQVVRRACEQLAAWRNEDVLPSEFRLHLNLSARELDSPDVVDVLEGLFRELDLHPQRVTFEVTESVAIESWQVLERIQDLGSPVAVDDFGTGYATLERLATLDLDTLKLDQLFVDEIGTSNRHEAVLQASLTLAEAMGVDPVAEGFETEEQRSWLLEHGCRFGQGFLFAPAVPAGELAGWLRSGLRLPA